MQRTNLLAALSIMTAAAAMPGSARTIARNRYTGWTAPQPLLARRSPSKRYPQMVTASPEEIAEHNKASWLRSRQVKRAEDRQLNKKARKMAIAAAGGIRQFKRIVRAQVAS